MIKEQYQVVILAGGESSRFAKTVEGDSPSDKLLAELTVGKTAIDLTLENIERFGVRKQDIIIVSSPSKYDLFKKKYLDCSIVLQSEARGNADAAAQAVPELRKKGEDAIVLLIQGDDSFTYDKFDYQRLVNNLLEHNADVAVMTLDPREQWDEKTKSFWQVVVGGDGMVQSVVKEGSGSTQALVNAFAMRANFFIEYMSGLAPNPLEKNEIILPDFMKAVLAHGGKIIAVPTKKFLGFNDFAQFAQAKLMFQAK